MQKFSELVQPHFSLDLLAPLNPGDQGDMAQLLLGTYIINARGILACQDIVNRVARAEQARKGLAESLVNRAARNNLEKVAQLLGSRTVTMTAVDPATEPIHFRGVTLASEITGVTNVHDTSGLKLAPVENVAMLRVFASIPHPYHTDRTDWWDGKVIGDDLEPLIAIEVGKPGSGRPSMLTRLRSAILDATSPY